MNEVAPAPLLEQATEKAPASQSSEMQAEDAYVLAKINGIAITQLPEDLYIPPGALEVFLEAFEGPLDLLLYLIRKNNLDILNIPIAQITYQYVEYVELMKGKLRWSSELGEGTEFKITFKK